METIIKQLKNAAKDTRLSAIEKSAIKSQLLHYVKTHPTGGIQSSHHSAPSPFMTFRNKKTLSAFVVGGLLLGSTVSFAAENTVPGDILYPVKIHINEQVLSVLSVTPQAKADWGVRKAERRLEEIEKLTEKPEVTPQIRAIAEANFNISTGQVQEHIANFENDDDSEDAIATAGKFADMLRKHEGEFNKKGFNEAVKSLQMASSTSQTLDSNATTTVVSEPLFRADKEELSKKKMSASDVFENIRDARGNAEKIQLELKNKYHKDRAREERVSFSLSTSTQDKPSFTEKADTSRNSREINQNTRGREHNEEIRAASPSTTPPLQQTEIQSKNDIGEE